MKCCGPAMDTLYNARQPMAMALGGPGSPLSPLTDPCGAQPWRLERRACGAAPRTYAEVTSNVVNRGELAGLVKNQIDRTTIDSMV